VARDFGKNYQGGKHMCQVKSNAACTCIRLLCEPYYARRPQVPRRWRCTAPAWGGGAGGALPSNVCFKAAHN
jgi:hypothetical protein